jgi:hypothetical protein
VRDFENTRKENVDMSSEKESLKLSHSKSKVFYDWLNRVE